MIFMEYILENNKAICNDKYCTGLFVILDT